MKQDIFYRSDKYVCYFPTTHAKIEKVHSGLKVPPLAIVGMTFDICKEQLRIVAERRLRRAEQEVVRCKEQLRDVLALKEEDV